MEILGEQMYKVIKTDSEYRDALVKIEQLMDIDPDPGTIESENLELLLLLVQNYERDHYSITPPDPIEAITFRMEQQNLSQRDLIPYLGSRSKVSEVLSKKRPLTLTMIRALHAGLGIPVEVLIQDDPETRENSELDWQRFPVKEMISRGWIKAVDLNAKEQIETSLRQYFHPLEVSKLTPVLYRKTHHVRSGRRTDEYALLAWSARIVHSTLDNPVQVDYVPGTVNLDFMHKIAQLSRKEKGPLLAKDILRSIGINLIIEPHLPKTHLDGAAILLTTRNPIIGLTLRYDRIDNFWFCLMHELAHISLHLDDEFSLFYDDLEVEELDDEIEKEADQLAGEALIPANIWEQSPVKYVPSPTAVESLARKLDVHPAIIAGRVRYELKAYRLLNNMVGHRQVRKLFSEIKWKS